MTTLVAPAAETAPAAPAPVAAAPAAAPAIAPPGVQPSPVAAAPAATTPAATAPAPAAPDAAAPAAKPAEAPFDLKYPEGFKGDPAALEAFKPIAKEIGLDAPKAQKLIEFFAKGEQARAAAQAATVAKWVAEVKSDPEIGGANLDKSITAARAGVKWAGGEQLAKTLDELGLGDHPALVRAFQKVGASLKEDQLAGTRSAPAVDNSAEAFHRQLFNNSPTMWGSK